jgi:hypothetical protein
MDSRGPDGRAGPRSGPVPKPTRGLRLARPAGRGSVLRGDPELSGLGRRLGASSYRFVDLIRRRSLPDRTASHHRCWSSSAASPRRRGQLPRASWRREAGPRPYPGGPSEHLERCRPIRPWIDPGSGVRPAYTCSGLLADAPDLAAGLRRCFQGFSPNMHELLMRLDSSTPVPCGGYRDPGVPFSPRTGGAP